MRHLVLRGLLAMSLPLALVVGATAAEKATSPTKPECTEMMQQSSPEARRAMRELMHSERSPQAMSNMMEMARRMGDGDVRFFVAARVLLPGVRHHLSERA